MARFMTIDIIATIYDENSIRPKTLTSHPIINIDLIVEIGENWIVLANSTMRYSGITPASMKKIRNAIDLIE